MEFLKKVGLLPAVVTGTCICHFTLSQILDKSTKINKNQNKPTQLPVTTTGQKIQISQPIAENWPGIWLLRMSGYFSKQTVSPPVSSYLKNLKVKHLKVHIKVQKLYCFHAYCHTILSFIMDLKGNSIQAN